MLVDYSETFFFFAQKNPDFVQVFTIHEFQSRSAQSWVKGYWFTGIVVSLFSPRTGLGIDV
jgi:hypothetical protein